MIIAAIVAGLVCCLLIHGYEIFNFTLSIDEELMLGGKEPIDYIQHGRWGNALRYWLFMPDTTVPITPIATGLALYAAAFILLVKRFRIQHWGAVAVAAPLFFGFPVLVYDVAFSNIVLIVGIGALGAVLALYASDRMRPAWFLVASVLVAYVTSLYQSLLYFVIVVFLADLVRLIWPPTRPTDRVLQLRLAWSGAIIVSGVLLYALIAFAFIKFSGVELKYITQFYQPDRLATDTAGVLRTTIEEAWAIYGGSARPFLGHDVYYRILIAACAVVLLWQLLATWKERKPVALLVTGLGLAMLAVPFLQHPLNGGTLPYRTLVAVPAAVAIPALFAAEISPSRLRHWILLPLAVLVLIEFSWISNRQYYGGHWALERDKAVANQIIARIGEMLPNQPAYTIAVVGALHRKHSPLIPRVPISTLGASFFEWDGGSSLRVAAFLNFLSDARFSPAEREQSKLAFETAVGMPSWPAANSIAQAGDVVVIKLSEPTASQLAPFCQDRSTGFCASYQPRGRKP